MDPVPPWSESSMAAVAALKDELRHGMYTYIRRARRPVTRDEAAAAVGISRKLAAFHLDKLVSAGVLTTSRPDGTAAHRVGRAPKAYQPAGADICVAIPRRRYDLLADILLDAVADDAASGPPRRAAIQAAEVRGVAAGSTERERLRPGRLGAERALTLVERSLPRYGFEPTREAAAPIRLRSCPFHPLVERAPALVCGINRAFLAGYLAGLHARCLEVVPSSVAGECCVEVRPTAARP